jgi:hypothetical protein
MPTQNQNTSIKIDQNTYIAYIPQNGYSRWVFTPTPLQSQACIAVYPAWLFNGDDARHRMGSRATLW